MKCIFCGLIMRFGDPREKEEMKAALEREAALPWWKPNNGDQLFAAEREPDRVRAAAKLRDTDPAQAFDAFLQLAEEGSVYSMDAVGRAMLHGAGTETDLEAGKTWLARAAGQGSQVAMLKLARQYMEEKRLGEAEEVLAGPAAEGYSPALYLMGFVYFRTGRKRQAREAWERAAALGHRPARLYLVGCYAKGWFGVFRMLRGYKLMKEISKDIAPEREKVVEWRGVEDVAGAGLMDGI